MPSTWFADRFRSNLLECNLVLVVLGYLSAGDLTEWEILSALYSIYGWSPSEKELTALLDSMVAGGFARETSGVGGRRLHVTAAGIELRRRLDEERLEIISTIDAGRGFPSRSGPR